VRVYSVNNARYKTDSDSVSRLLYLNVLCDRKCVCVQSAYCNQITMGTVTTRCYSTAVTLLISMAATFDLANSGSYGDPLAGRQQATYSGLCRVYSYNVEREYAYLPWEPVRHSNEHQPLPEATDRRHFICCHHDGTESACRDKTYQRPDSVNQRAAEGQLLVSSAICIRLTF